MAIGRRIAVSVVAVGMALMAGGPLECLGDSHTWAGPANGDWFTPGNWSGSEVPVGLDRHQANVADRAADVNRALAEVGIYASGLEAGSDLE